MKVTHFWKSTCTTKIYQVHQFITHFVPDSMLGSEDAAMATTIGKGMRATSAEFVELEDNFEGGTLVSVDLTGEAPETRRSVWNTNAL